MHAWPGRALPEHYARGLPVKVEASLSRSSGSPRGGGFV